MDKAKKLFRKKKSIRFIKLPQWARLDRLAGRIWPPGRMLDTPGLKADRSCGGSASMGLEAETKVDLGNSEAAIEGAKHLRLDSASRSSPTSIRPPIPVWIGNEALWFVATLAGLRFNVMVFIAMY